MAPDTASDTDLWHRAAAGDRPAFGELFECREVKLVRDPALPWLYTVAGNVARNEYRGTTRFLRAVRRLPHRGGP